MYTVQDVKKELKKYAIPERATASMRFFKTAKGQYGAGDTFIGVTVPQQRKVAKQFKDLRMPSVLALLKSPVHEHRLTALFILVHQFQKGDDTTQKAIYDAYLAHAAYVNNWDLVDSSAHKIVGEYLLTRPRKKLYTLAHSKDLWEKRIAIIATMQFIAHEEYEDALAIAEILRDDTHDLIHKAVGWMLREVGKKDRATEERFLKKHAAHMPRTMLRYAIEKFPEKKRQAYLRAEA